MRRAWRLARNSPTSKRGDDLFQLFDEIGAVWQMPDFGFENGFEGALLEGELVDAAFSLLDRRRVVKNVDDALRGMEPSPEIVVFAIPAREEGAELTSTANL